MSNEQELQVHNRALVEALIYIAAYPGSTTRKIEQVLAANPATAIYKAEQGVIDMAIEEVDCNPFVYIDLREAVANLQQAKETLNNEQPDKSI